MKKGPLFFPLHFVFFVFFVVNFFDPMRRK